MSHLKLVKDTCPEYEFRALMRQVRGLLVEGSYIDICDYSFKGGCLTAHLYIASAEDASNTAQISVAYDPECLHISKSGVHAKLDAGALKEQANELIDYIDAALKRDFETVYLH